MGLQQSRPRKLTMENENPMNVIKVSSDVVDRLKGLNSAAAQNMPVRNPQNQLPGRDMGAGDVLYTHLHEPSLTSLQLRQANLLALKDNDKYWEQRICELMDNHEQMHKKMDTEYKKVIEESGPVEQHVITDTTVPCQSVQKRVMECYKKNQREPMKCAKEVQEFAACVDKRSASLMASRC